MISTVIKDGLGRDNEAEVTSNNSLKVTAVAAKGSENAEEVKRYKVWKEFFFDDLGTSKDMRVDGSVTPQLFQVRPNIEWIKYVTKVKIILSGIDTDIATNDFRKFTKGFTTGLTNGVEFFVQQDGNITNIFAEPVTNLGQFLQYIDGHTSYSNSISASIDYMDFTAILDVPIPLIPNTNDYAGFRINDNLNDVNIDSFFVIASGYFEEVEVT